MARIVRGDTRLGFFFLCIVLAWATTATADDPAATPTPTPTLSGCQVCAASGDCSHAYLDGPGQFCGNWLDKASQRQRCCCPREASCRLSNYECRCSWNTPSPTKTNKPATSNVSSGGWVGVAVGAFMFMACCSGACWSIQRVVSHIKKNNINIISNSQRLPHATAVPMVYGQPACNVVPMSAPGVVYGAGPVHYPYAGVPSAPVYGYGHENYGHHHHHGGGGLSTGLGAVAGLVTGMVVADAIFDGGHHGDYGGGGGYDGGGGGGYDGGGGGGYDGGGGGGGGDSGGGGGDFGGDF